MTFNVDRKHKQNNHTFIKDYILNYALLTISNDLNDNFICDLNDNKYLDKLCKKSSINNNNSKNNRKIRNIARIPAKGIPIIVAVP